jgi:hypothetical protein
MFHSNHKVESLFEHIVYTNSLAVLQATEAATESTAEVVDLVLRDCSFTIQWQVAPGCWIKSNQAFKADDQSSTLVEEGICRKVVEIDGDGHALIDFEEKGELWVFKDDFGCLDLISAAEARVRPSLRMLDHLWLQSSVHDM